VTDARTGESEKKLFTFTSKNGANKFVPVSAIRPLKNYARTQKHDPSTTRTHENALTNNPQCQPRNSLQDHASMDAAPATTTRATDASATVPEENIHDGDIFVQAANIDPALEDLSTAADFFDNNSIENLMVMSVDNQDTAGGHSQTLDLGSIMQDSSNVQFVVVDGDSTAVAGQEFTLIRTYDNNPEMVQVNPSLSPETSSQRGFDDLLNCTLYELGRTLLRGSQKEPRRHTKGPKKTDLSEIPEQNRRNVLRCRKYRVNKNIKVANWEDELKSLETRNEELKEQEKAMMERLAKVQGAYINLIKAGRIKCV